MPLIRTNTATAADEVRRSDDAAALAARLASPDAAVRRAAAHALGEWPQHAPLLAAALAGEPEQAVRSAMLGALARIGSEDAVAGLAGCLRSEDAWLRNAAIEELRAMPDQVAGVIAHLLADWDRDVRILAVGVLDTLRHERVEEWLLQLIDADADVNVCGAALDVLASVATERAHAPVAALVERFADEPYIAFTGKLVLGRLARGG
jgi:HEAT repeat protein